MNEVSYANHESGDGYLKVEFMNENGVELARNFNSEYKARNFVNKLKHSKRCTLISYPLFK